MINALFATVVFAICKLFSCESGLNISLLVFIIMFENRFS